MYRNLTPRQILEIQISENIHRADLSPVEEAEVYSRMRGELGMAAEDIALRAGKSLSHVRRYQNLLSLPEDVLAKIDGGEIQISKGIYLSTLSAHIVEKLVNGNYKYLLDRSAKEFVSQVQRLFMRELDGDPPFDKAKEYRYEGGVYPPCAKCPGRKQMALFPELIGESGCPDEECYYAKRDAVEEEKEEERRKTARKSAGSGGGGDGDGEDNCFGVDDDDDEDEEETEEERAARLEYEAERAAFAVVRAYIVYAVYSNALYCADEMTEWLGCETYAEPEDEKEKD